jgi:hypothetical protein
MKKMAGLQRNAGEDKDDRRQREHDKEMARIAAQVETPASAKAVPLRSSSESQVGHVTRIRAMAG